MLADTSMFSPADDNRLTSPTDTPMITARGIYTVRSDYRSVCVPVCQFMLHRMAKLLVTLNDTRDLTIRGP